MSGFLSWFGGSAAKQRKDSPREAILLLRGQRDMLMKRADHLLSQISTEEDSARTFVASNKILAKQALVRKKGHEKVLEQTHAQIATLDQQITAIESANINVSTLEAMQKAAKAMEVIHDKLTPQKVDETMDRLRDQNDLSNEIMNAISSNPLGHDVDETELEEELEELEQERLNDQMLKTGQVPVSDVVHKAAYRAPTTSRPTVQEDPDEAELRKLERRCSWYRPQPKRSSASRQVLQRLAFPPTPSHRDRRLSTDCEPPVAVFVQPSSIQRRFPCSTGKESWCKAQVRCSSSLPSAHWENSGRRQGHPF